jgi:hypothetical protein
MTYVGIDSSRADVAWQGLVSAGRDEIVNSRTIAQLMGVSVPTATRYRRAFDALGLLIDVPGTYNPEPLGRPAFAGDQIEEGVVGYDQWAAADDMNDPARVYLNSRATEGFSDAVEEMSGGRVVELRVASRRSPRCDDSVASFARSEPVPTKVWCRPMPRAVGSGLLHNNYLYFYKEPVTPDEPTRSPEWSDRPPPMLLLVPSRKEHVARSTERSEALSRRHRVDPFSVGELADLIGRSPATAKRRLAEWMQSGEVVKVRRGRYRFVEDVAGLDRVPPGERPCRYHESAVTPPS